MENRANEKVDEPLCPHYASVHAWDANKVGWQAWKVSMEVAWLTSRSPPAEAGKMTAGWYLLSLSSLLLLLLRLRSYFMPYSSRSVVDSSCPFAHCGRMGPHAGKPVLGDTPAPLPLE